MRFRISILLLFVFCFISNLKASNLVDTLQQRLADYNREKPAINLYVHLDRNNYMPEDTIWFKAYVLTPLLNEVLYVRLADHNKNIVLEKQFPMYDVRAHGDLMLPDTLPEGSYHFFAYTDRMISFNPSDVFVQPITISKVIVHKLEAEASVTNIKKIHRGDKVEIRTLVKGAPGKSLKGRFDLWVGSRLYKKGAFSTNNYGEAYLRFTYPKIENTEMLRCEIRFTQGKEVANLTLNLRHEGNTAKMNISPEGGHFLEGLPNKAVIEVFDDNRNPLQVPIELLGDQQMIARTNTDKYGLASIRFTPQSKVHYQIKVYENDSTTLLEFPDSIETIGMGLRLEATKNGISAILNNKGANDSATLVLRSKDKIFWSSTYQVKPGDSLKIDVPAKELPKSVLSLAVFDSLCQPKAERLFLNKPMDSNRLKISSTRRLTKGRNNLQVHLNVVDAEDKPIVANLSVSIVEKSTLERATFRTILQSYYFKNLLGNRELLHNESDPGFDDKLMTLNWGQKKWSRLLTYRSTGYVRLLENTGGINGKVHSIFDKKVKLCQLMLESSTLADKKELAPMMKMFGGNTQRTGSYRLGKINYTVKDWMEAVPIDSSGNFSIPYKSLLVNPNETKLLKTGVFFSNDYRLELTDYSTLMDEFIQNGNALETSRPVSSFTKYVAPPIKMLSKVVELREVDVESRSGLFLSERNIGRKEDYVCSQYNVFNCRNHRTGGRKPIIGRVYVKNEQGDLFLYNGVGKPFSPAPDGAVAGSLQYVLIKNIGRPNTFYNPEISDSLFLKAETRTTVYWSPNLFTDSTGNITFPCNLSDRTGEFIIVVQGLDVKTRKPIYGTYEFNL